MAKSIVEPLLPESYVRTIRNSVGARLFRNFYAKVHGKKQDILKNGELSCAVYVSWVLVGFGLLESVHATVAGTLKDLKASGWRRTRKRRPGSVLHYESQNFSDGPHEHLGFYLGKGKAVSNSRKKRAPAIHHWTFGENAGKPRRRVIGIYRHPKLKR